MRKYIPYVGAALLCAIVAAFSLVAIHAGSKPHGKSNTAKTTHSTSGIAEAGFQFAAALNAQPPVTNKIIGEVVCSRKTSNQYACIFIGNNKGVIYCAGYEFSISNSKIQQLNARRLPNAYCGL